MQQRALGQTGLTVSPIGFGAFKIGRNQKTKYPQPYDLPSDSDVDNLLNRVLEIGITYIDTAPAYGVSEQQIGRVLSGRRDEFVLSTKVGEAFIDGTSIYDYSAAAITASIDRSRRLLRSERLNLVFIHSNGDDEKIQNDTDAVETLRDLKQQGVIQAIGMSAKTVAGTRMALEWADAVMVEYHLDDQSHSDVIDKAAELGIGVVVKKGLAAGHLSPDEAIQFVLSNRHVGSLVIGGLNTSHIQSNVDAACAIL